jgi:hypothetical protein
MLWSRDRIIIRNFDLMKNEKKISSHEFDLMKKWISISWNLTSWPWVNLSYYLTQHFSAGQDRSSSLQTRPGRGRTPSGRPWTRWRTDFLKILFQLFESILNQLFASILTHFSASASATLLSFDLKRRPESTLHLEECPELNRRRPLEKNWKFFYWNFCWNLIN